MNSITVKVTKNYGVEAIYPVSDEAKVFARLAGTRTLTRQTLELVKKLGYAITVEQVSL
jgi:hypothetical protein